MFKKLIYLIICIMLLSACTKSDNKINNEVKQEEDKKEQDKKEQDKKEIDVNNLIDDINSIKVENAIRSMFFDHEKYLIKKLDRGFTLIVIGKQDNGEYFSKLYDNIFLSSKGFVKLRKNVPDKKYDSSDFENKFISSAQLTNIKEIYLDEYIEKYKEQGYILRDIK